MNKKNMAMDIGHKIRIAHNYIDKYFKTTWEEKEVELTRMQCATMRYLAEHEEENVFQRDLEAAFSISGATATNILKVMEKEALILRVPMETDARLKRIQMTDKAKEIDRAAHENVHRLEEGMKKGFSEEEITRFREYLDRLTQNIVDLMEENPK